MRRHLLVLSAASMLLVACVTTVPRGHLKEDESLENVKTGTTTRAEVQKLLGSPSSQSSFGPPTWYYVSSIREQSSLFATKVVDQNVIEIAFDTGGVVTQVKHYKLSDGKQIEIASETTPTEGQRLGFFEQIFDNLGRFNKNQSATDNSHTHLPSPTGYPR